MREIKFLAYVNNPIHGKGVFPVKSIHFDPFVCEIVMGDEIVNFFDFDDITLLEYTGLKDKNGTEIYECDIVKGRYYDNFSRKEFDIVCIVRWDKSGYWTFDGRDKRFTGGYLTDIRDIEVVGNKYENPEWLEAKGNE